MTQFVSKPSGCLCKDLIEALEVHGPDVSRCCSSLSQQLCHHNPRARPIQDAPAAVPCCNVGSLEARNLPNGWGAVV